MPEARSPWPADVQDAIGAYYRRYYHDTLRLPDWEARVALRRNEEETFAAPMIDRLVRWFDIDPASLRVLVVGAGTGAEVFELVRRGATVFAVEPDPQGLAIMHQKADSIGHVGRSQLVDGVAENLPFEPDSFDLVYCYTVLEHVADVEKSIDEMLRVCKASGAVFIETPNSRYPYEGHYKLRLLPFAPRWAQRLYLRLIGRYTPYFESINFITKRQLDWMLWKRNVTIIRVEAPFFINIGFSLRDKIHAWCFGGQKNQFVLLRKPWI